MNKAIVNQIENNFNLTEKEKEDVIHALEIMEKVSKAELTFAGYVLDQLKVKTTYATMGKEWTMKYCSLEEIKAIIESDKNIDVLKH